MPPRAHGWKGCAAAVAPLIIASSLLLPGAVFAQSSRHAQAGWARLRFETGGPAWNRHQEADLVAVARLRAVTSLAFVPTVHGASLDDLSEMVKYPFILSYGLHRKQRTQRQKENLCEYLKRGGFLLVEECANRTVTPDPLKEFFASQEFFLKLLPGSRPVLLRREHPIFHCFYEMNEGVPFTRSPGYRYDSGKVDGLAAIRYEGRMAAIVSSACLHCGWEGWGPPGHPERSLQMAVNIFIYLMTDGR